MPAAPGIDLDHVVDLEQIVTVHRFLSDQQFPLRRRLDLRPAAAGVKPIGMALAEFPGDIAADVDEIKAVPGRGRRFVQRYTETGHLVQLGPCVDVQAFRRAEPAIQKLAVNAFQRASRGKNHVVKLHVAALCPAAQADGEESGVFRRIGSHFEPLQKS